MKNSLLIASLLVMMVVGLAGASAFPTPVIHPVDDDPPHSLDFEHIWDLITLAQTPTTKCIGNTDTWIASDDRTVTHVCHDCGHTWSTWGGMVGGRCPACGYNPSINPIYQGCQEVGS